MGLSGNVRHGQPLTSLSLWMCPPQSSSGTLYPLFDSLMCRPKIAYLLPACGSRLPWVPRSTPSVPLVWLLDVPAEDRVPIGC